jgi:hypothetical protein
MRYFYVIKYRQPVRLSDCLNGTSYVNGRFNSRLRLIFNSKVLFDKTRLRRKMLPPLPKQTKISSTISWFIFFLSVKKDVALVDIALGINALTFHV